LKLIRDIFFFRPQAGYRNGFKKPFLNLVELEPVRKLPSDDSLSVTLLARRRAIRLGRLVEAFLGRHDGPPQMIP